MRAAEAALDFTASGPGRFADARAFIARTLDDTIAVGPLDEPFAGPHFFFAAGFDDMAPGAAPFPALKVFVPRWQVARMGDSTVAVANLLVTADTPVDLVTAKVWKAHAKFGAFDYSRARHKERPSAPQRAEEVGGAGSYQRAVARALAEIAHGDYEKVVLARALKYTTTEEFHPISVLNHLRRRYPDCYSFSIANGRGQSFIGATPERLVRVAGGRMHTTALAGSAARGEFRERRPRRSPRRSTVAQAEKGPARGTPRLVFDAIVSRLAGLDLEARAPQTNPRLLGLANVHHLHLPISANLPSGAHILDLVARLHPTPAVGGAPQAPALAAIARLESFPRGLYAGPQGWVDHRGGGEFFVGLRSALIDGRTATVYAGAGIVAGSEPREGICREPDLKFKALLEALTES